MKVRICGPNLSSAAQRRGAMHIHAEGCQDLLKYGPGRPMGGDLHGDRETLMDADSCMHVVMVVYSDQIDEAVNDEQTREDIASEYLSDVWFAPCCKALPLETFLKPVYECWVSDDKSTFARVYSPNNVTRWLEQRQKNGLKRGDHIHIVVHDASEYTS